MGNVPKVFCKAMDLTQKSLSAVTSLSNKILLGSSGTSGFPIAQLQMLFNTDSMISHENPENGMAI